MKNPFTQEMPLIHGKRRTLQGLTEEEFSYLLADTMLDRGLFSSPNWNWRYGGVKYDPGTVMKDSISRILVLQWPGQLGDVCMSGPFLSLLRQKHPGAEVSLLSSRAAQELFAGNGDVNTLLTNPLDPYLDEFMHGRPIDPMELLADVRRLTHRMREGRFDLLINLQVLPMSACLAKLCNARSTIGMSLTGDGIPEIAGNIWSAYLFCLSAGFLRRYNLLHRTSVFCWMVDDSEPPCPAPRVRINPAAGTTAQAFFDREGIEDRDLVVGIHPLSGTPIRQWKHYADLAKRLRDELKAKVIFFGAAGERQEIDRIASQAGAGTIRATGFSLQELMAAHCGLDLLITNDTGPMHLSCLLGRKTVALFGPTSLHEVGPWQGEFHTLQSSSCNGCYNQVCAHPEDFCMDRIRMEDVFRLTQAVIRGEPAPNPGTHLRYHGFAHVEPESPERAADFHLLREVLCRRNRTKGAEASPPISIGEKTDPLLRECKRMQGLLESALRSLKRRGGPNRIQKIHHEISKANGLLKPLIVMNDLQFLEKRILLEQDPRSFQRYCLGILDDLKTMTNCVRGG
jgi:ADP-heptose:LPS heptosyltransferase